MLICLHTLVMIKPIMYRCYGSTSFAKVQVEEEECMQSNHLGNALANKTKYDAEIKSVLSDKTVLAWILKYTTDEFKEIAIQEIISCIEGEPAIGRVPVYPGSGIQLDLSDEPARLVNASCYKEPLEVITGLSTENSVPNEGKIIYDMRFYVVTPTIERVKMFINVEVQNDYYPGYDLVPRGVFYGARMLSSQLDTEFSTDNYNDIKKVYSIWICVNTPQYAQNTITEYSMTPKKLYGDFQGRAKYDLISVVMVCLGEEGKGSQLHQMLSTLLSANISLTEKKERLQKDYNISTMKIEKGVSNMCNLSEGIEAKGIQKGLMALENAICELRQGISYEIVCKKYGEDVAVRAKRLQ